MLWLKLSSIIFVLASFLAINAQRRIKDGFVSEGKRYMVYLVKAPISPMKYDAWLCGGAIVSEWYIVTSAACVEDVEHLYAIAGYKKYVHIDQQEEDECTKSSRKKIVLTCVPKPYELDYSKIEKWAYIDIAVVKVETAYKFDDQETYANCDYTPALIPVSYEMKYQQPGVDAIVLGWGHEDKWRKPTDYEDLNQPFLKYTSIQIYDKEACKTYFTNVEQFATIIDRYMICTLEMGNLNESGNLIKTTKPLADGCTPKLKALMRGDLICEEDETILLDDDETRKKMDGRKTFARILERQQTKTRRQGICQNDHGGPLVTWVGQQEYLIGVASVFRVTNQSTCTGPFLFTSTQCNGAFIDCVMSAGKTRRKDFCDLPASEKGFDTIKRSISWEGHPDGPAENDRIMMRPLEPINKFLKWPTSLK